MQLTIYINTLPWLFHYLYYGMSNLHKQRTGIEFSPTNRILNNIIYKSKYAMRRDLVNFLSLFCTDLVKAVPDEHKKFLANLVWVHEEVTNVLIAFLSYFSKPLMSTSNMLNHDFFRFLSVQFPLSFVLKSNNKPVHCK
jgi:hypothetical protein